MLSIITMSLWTKSESDGECDSDSDSGSDDGRRRMSDESIKVVSVTLLE